MALCQQQHYTTGTIGGWPLVDRAGDLHDDHRMFFPITSSPRPKSSSICHTLYRLDTLSHCPLPPTPPRSVDVYLILSGIIMGLAWLTKTPAIFLVPIGAALIAQRCFQKPPFTLHLTSFTLWGIIATATFVLLWPAMWLEPIGTLTRMATEMSDYVSRHVNPNYFMGQPTSDPGVIFYPVAWLFRSTPIAWIGLTAAALCRWRCQPPFDQPRINQIMLALLIFALLFTAGMSIGAKKFDRYILPTFLALNVIGAIGLWYFLKTIFHRRTYLATLIAPFILVLIHGMLGFLHYPYYLTYYNPFTGGSRTAPAILFTGWGDGLDGAAEWLNQQGGEDVENLRVASWYADGPFSYFFKGQATSISYGSPLFWLGTDYAVLYVNQWQRQIPSAEMIDYFFAQEPAHVVRSGGLELARVYNLQDTLLPDFLDIGKESAADFGNQIRLAAYRIDQQQAMPSDQFQATFYLQSLAPMTTNYNVLVRLVDRADNELWRDEGWPWGAPTAQWPIREVRPDGHKVAIPDEAAAGLYRFLLSFYDPVTLDSLPIMDARSGQPIDGTERPVALLQVGAPPLAREMLDPLPHFGTSFTLNGFTLPAQIQSGEILSLQLQWQSLQRTPTDYTAFVHIVDANGTLAAQWDQPPLAGFAPTHLWTPGQALLDSYEIPLPEDLPAGRYTVRVGLYTLASGRLPVSEGKQAVGDFVVVGAFDVVENSE